MSDTLPIDANSAALGTGRHVSGVADPFNGHIDTFRIPHIQRSDGPDGTTLATPVRSRPQEQRSRKAAESRPRSSDVERVLALPVGQVARVAAPLAHAQLDVGARELIAEALAQHVIRLERAQ